MREESAPKRCRRRVGGGKGSRQARLNAAHNRQEDWTECADGGYNGNYRLYICFLI